MNDEKYIYFTERIQNMLCKPEILRMMKEDQEQKEKNGIDVYGGRSQELEANKKTRKSMSPILSGRRRKTVQLDENHVPTFGGLQQSEEELKEKRQKEQDRRKKERAQLLQQTVHRELVNDPEFKKDKEQIQEA